MATTTWSASSRPRSSPTCRSSSVPATADGSPGSTAASRRADRTARRARPTRAPSGPGRRRIRSSAARGSARGSPRRAPSRRGRARGRASPDRRGARGRAGEERRPARAASGPRPGPRRGRGTRAPRPTRPPRRPRRGTPSTWYAWSATVEAAGLLEVAVDAVLAGEGDEPGEVLDALGLEAGRPRRGSGGSPLARPWVRLAWQKPPLRPLAPKPTVAASSDRRPAARIRVGQGDRGPQPGEPGADDRDVGAPVPVERRAADRPGAVAASSYAHRRRSCRRPMAAGMVARRHVGSCGSPHREPRCASDSQRTGTGIRAISR